MQRVIGQAAICQRPNPVAATFYCADLIDGNSCAGYQAASGLEMQYRQRQAVSFTFFRDFLGDHTDIILNHRLWQFVFVIRRTPSAAWTEMPGFIESDFFHEVECQSDGGDERAQIAEVRALVKMQACQR